MNKPAGIITAKNAFVALLLLSGLFLAFLAPKAAVNVDEQLHYPHAKKVVNWYFTGGNDTSCLDTPVTNLKYYGQSVDNFTALINRLFLFENEFLVRHFTGALFFWLLLIFSGLVARQVSGNYLVSVVTVLSLLLMPRLFGHAFGNLKDIPFAAGYAAGIYWIIRFLDEMPSPRWSTAIWLSLAIAFTCSVRVGGLILFAYLGLFGIIYLVLKPFELKHIFSTRPFFVRLLGQLTVIAVVGYFAGLLFWPFALQNVFRNPLASLGMMEHYKVSIRQVFEGNLLWSTQLPWYYLPKWLLISTPEFIILGFLLYIFFTARKMITSQAKDTNRFLTEAIVVFAFLFPAVYVIIIGANLYSGVRQMIFILPLLAILASTGFYRWIQSGFSKIIKIPVIIIFIGLMIFPLKHQAATFPADYIYFNSLAGGNRKAWSNYEYDYYFHSLKKPAEYLIELLKNEKQAVVAINCNLTQYFDGSPTISTRYVRYLERSSQDWDYALFGLNYIHPWMLKNNTWPSSEIVKTFYHRGNPVAVILKNSDKTAFRGLAELENGNREEGEKLLKQTLANDPYNVWLYVNLAKSALISNKHAEFHENMDMGKSIYPFYEPFYLLEAQKYFTENEYKKSLAALNELLKINPRYEPAASLLAAVKEKLNESIINLK